MLVWNTCNLNFRNWQGCFRLCKCIAVKGLNDTRSTFLISFINKGTWTIETKVVQLNIEVNKLNWTWTGHIFCFPLSSISFLVSPQESQVGQLSRISNLSKMVKIEFVNKSVLSTKLVYLLKFLKICLKNDIFSHE